MKRYCSYTRVSRGTHPHFRKPKKIVCATCCRKESLRGSSGSSKKADTPTKKRVRSMTSGIVALPGTSKRPTSLSAKAKRAPTKNRCQICNVNFESKKDLELKKKNGKQNTWLGCDVGDCSYWAPARCAGIKLKPKQRADKTKFLCPEHKEM